jgi:hypothetical protein
MKYDLPLSIRGSTTNEIVSIVVWKFDSLRIVQEISVDDWILLLSRRNVGKIERKGSWMKRILQKGINDRLGLIVPIVVCGRRGSFPQFDRTRRTNII